jgi:ribosomal protein L1
MDEDAFNLSIRKFLKHFGVTAQREIESAVRKAIEEGKLRGDEAVPVRATLVVDGLLRDFHIDGTVTLSGAPATPAS